MANNVDIKKLGRLQVRSVNRFEKLSFSGGETLQHTIKLSARHAHGSLLWLIYPNLAHHAHGK